jgi:hypothetical protein
LQDIVTETFNKLLIHHHQQGGLVYIQLINDVIFNMTEPVIRVLQVWIKGFTKHGLYKMPGQVSTQGRYTPFRCVQDILTGLTNASNDGLTHPFKLLRDFRNQTIIDLGKLKTKTTLERIKTYLTQALDSNVIHVVNNTWKAKSLHGLVRDIICCICGKHDHDLHSYPEPCNQEHINKARGESKNSQNPKLGGSGGGGSKYSQGKFGKPSAQGKMVCFVNNKSHAWCASCGWTTTDSTKFHDAWSTNKSTFVLHDKHPLTVAKQGGLKKESPTKTKTKKTSNGGETSKGDNDNPQSGVSLASLGKHFAQMELLASDPTQANMALLLKNIFQGKV